MRLRRRVGLTGWVLLVGGCFGPTIIHAPELSQDTRTILLVHQDVQTSQLSATLVARDAYEDADALLALLSAHSPTRMWIEQFSASPEELGAKLGPLPLAGVDECGVRPFARGESSVVLHPGHAAFVLDPSSSRPDLLHLGPCVCPRLVVREIAVDAQCEIEPAPLPDGRALLAFARQPECGLPPPREFTLATLELDSLEISVTTTLGYSLSAPLSAADGVTYWGARRTAGSLTSSIARSEFGKELEVLTSTPGIGRINAMTWEVERRTLLFLANREQSNPRVPSRLFRLDVMTRRMSELVLPDEANPNESQADVLLQREDGDVLVFPGNSHLWHRVRGGTLESDQPSFDGQGRVHAGLVHPELGPTITTRSGQLLRFENSAWVPLSFSVAGGRQPLGAPFFWRGSVGLFTQDGVLRQYHPEEPHCPSTLVSANLREPSAVVIGDQVLVAGVLRDSERAGLFLLRASP